MSDTPEGAPPAKKKGKLPKILMMVGALVVLVGGGVGAGLYAANAGLVGGGAHEPAEKGHAETPERTKPHLVPKSEQKKAGEGAEGGEGGHGSGGGEEGAAKQDHGVPTPEGEGGDEFASNYYAFDKEFTSNLQNSVHIVQLGVALSTPYDDTVIEHIKTNEIAVRSAVLMALGDTTEDQVFTFEGKKQLQRRLAGAINDVLKQKEGFGGVSNVYFTNFVVQ